MKCTYCGGELKEGKSLFTSMNGIASMMLMSFTSEEEEKKAFFKRNTKDAVVLSGDEKQAFYCENCRKTTVVFED